MALLKVAPKWTLRIVFPRPLDRVYDAYQTVVHEELESPLHTATIGELKWYFENRDQATREPVHPQKQAFLTVGARAFGAPRFTEMCQRWLKHGNAVFEGPSSPVIAEALNTGAGRVEHSSCRIAIAISPPWLTARARGPKTLRRGLRREPQGGTLRPHALNPLPQPLVVA